MARLVGGTSEALMAMLEEAYQDGSWVDSVRSVRNPFGNGDSAWRIAHCVTRLLRNVTDSLEEKVVDRC
jgi:UDP-N-acetylglucosamine 2-epimerase